MLDPALLTEAQKVLHQKPAHELTRQELEEALSLADRLGDRDRHFALNALKLSDQIARTDGATGAIVPATDSGVSR